MDFDEYVVVEVEDSGDGIISFSLLSIRGHKLVLYLREKSLTEARFPPDLGKTIKKVFAVGNIVHCNFLLQRYPEKFSLCLYAFSQQEIVRLDDGTVITPEEYLDESRDYMVIARSIGEYHRIDPTLFDVGGQAFLPIRSGFEPRFLTLDETNLALQSNDQPAFIWWTPFLTRVKFVFQNILALIRFLSTRKLYN